MWDHVRFGVDWIYSLSGSLILVNFHNSSWEDVYLIASFAFALF